MLGGTSRPHPRPVTWAAAHLSPPEPSLPALPPGRLSGRCHLPAVWPPTRVSPNLGEAPSCVTPWAGPRSPGGPLALPASRCADPPEPPRPASPGPARPRPGTPPPPPGCPTTATTGRPGKRFPSLGFRVNTPQRLAGGGSGLCLSLGSGVTSSPLCVPKLVSRPLTKTAPGHPHPRGLTCWTIKI